MIGRWLDDRPRVLAFLPSRRSSRARPDGGPRRALGARRPPRRRRARASLAPALLRGRLGTPARGGVVDAGAFIAPRRAPPRPAREAGPRAAPPGARPLGVNDDGDDSAPPPPPPPPEGRSRTPAQARGGPRRGRVRGVVVPRLREARRGPRCPLSGADRPVLLVLRPLGVPLSAYGALAYGLVAALAVGRERAPRRRRRRG